MFFNNLKKTIVALLICVGIVASYTTKDNKIYDQDGNPVLLRGFARPSLEWNPEGEKMTLQDYTNMKNKGANAVRLSINQCYWLEGHAGYSKTYASNIKQQVDWLKSLKMAAILDLHWSDKGNMQLSECSQQNMADINSVKFWNQLASAYKNDPMVIFELYNEPHDVSWTTWLNGGTDSGYKTVGMQTLYDEVRSTGANNVVIVNGLNWGFDLSGVAKYPISGTNIVYGTHAYDYSGKQLSDYQNAFGYLASKYPLIATEFGQYDCKAGYNQLFVDYANQLSISWTAWAWYVNGCSFPSAIDDWNGSPSVSGMPVFTDLKCTNKVPGQTYNTCNPTSMPSPTPNNGSQLKLHLHPSINGWWFAIELLNGDSVTYVEVKDSDSIKSFIPLEKSSWKYWIMSKVSKPLVYPLYLNFKNNKGSSFSFTLRTNIPDSIVDTGLNVNI